MKTFRTTKTGRLFQTIFLIQCLLLGCVLAYVTLLMNRLVLREQTRELDASNIRVLEQKSQSIDNTVDRLKEQMRLFLSEKTVMLHLVNPEENGAEDRMEILTLMQRYVRLSSEVNRMWLYRPIKADVLSSDGYFTSKSLSKIPELLEHYEELPHQRCEQDLLLTTMTENAQLYLVLEFAPGARLGCFIFELNQESIDTREEREGRAGVLIVERDGGLLMEAGSLTEEEHTVDLSDPAAFYTEDSGSRSRRQQYYRVDNEKLGWSLLMKLGGTPSVVRMRAFWAVTIPALLVLLFLGVGAAWLITRRIYTPINRLLSLAADRTGGEAGERNEPDYLESAWRQTLEDNQQLRSRFRVIGSDMRQYFCRQAIQGRLEPSEDMDALEAVIPEGYFQTVQVRMQKSSLEMQNPLQFSLMCSALNEGASKLPGYLCSLEERPETLILVFGFPELSAQPESSVIEGLIGQAEKETRCRLAFGLGRPCQGLINLKESFEQGSRDLQYKLYLGGQPESAGAGSKDDAAREKDLKESLVPLIDSALQSAEPAEPFAQQIVRIAGQSAGGDSDRLQAYIFAQDLLLEKLLSQEELLSSLRLVREEDDPAEAGGLLEEVCRKAILTGRELAGKKQYMYVEAGKAYMRENFQNASLGVSDISTHVGISSAYFSSLFNEQSQESVTSYLNRLRVEQACAMLRATHIPVKEVGFRCGFNSANVFGRVFKKFTGQSPKQYRDAQGEGGSGEREN